jgi:hypothetical protein
MLMTSTSEIVHAVLSLARRADSTLAQGAARNAAVCVAERGARRLEDARTMRDLSRLGFEEESAASGARPSNRR